MIKYCPGESRPLTRFALTQKEAASVKLSKPTIKVAHAFVTLSVMVAFGDFAQARGRAYRIIYDFGQGSSDGWWPIGVPAVDKNGDLYGTTAQGGAENNGTIFKLSAPETRGGVWRETILHNFAGGSGGWPVSHVFGQDGSLYGFALGNNMPVCGFIWKLTPPAFGDGVWTYAVLYTLNGTSDGCLPQGNPVFDAQGNLYGSTELGGDLSCLNGQSCGTVFELKRPATKSGKWHFKVLHTFTGKPDGAQPFAGVTFDQKGNLYGTTFNGGSYDGGSVYRMGPPKKKGPGWTETVIYSFDGTNNIMRPEGPVTFDGSGNLYGTTPTGGDLNCDGGYGCGVVFELATPTEENGDWTYATLYAFTGGSDGSNGGDPSGKLVFDAKGNLYGTAPTGYTFAGTVFRLGPPTNGDGQWTETTLHGFTDRNGDGGVPVDVTWGKWGDLYGVTYEGGLCLGCGTVYEVRP